MTGYYILARYVEDPARCEPINFGVILQENTSIDCRFVQRQDRKMPRLIYKMWADAISEEINDLKEEGNVSSMRMFNLSLNFEDPTGHVIMTKPMIIDAPQESFEQVLDRLFTTLVKPKE